jgi:hypothetical protein
MLRVAPKPNRAAFQAVPGRTPSWHASARGLGLSLQSAPEHCASRDATYTMATGTYGYSSAAATKRNREGHQAKGAITLTATVATLIVAIIAAGASICNIFLSARLGRKSEATRWIRTERLLFLARFLSASDQYRELMRKKASIMDKDGRDSEAAGTGYTHSQNYFDICTTTGAKWDELEQLRAELDVTAPADVVRAAHNLMAAGHSIFRHMLRPGGTWPKQPQFAHIESNYFTELRVAYRDAVREALGVERLGELSHLWAGRLPEHDFRHRLSTAIRRRMGRAHESRSQLRQ